MSEESCKVCGWFNPNKDGSFYCPCANRTVRKITPVCKYIELVNGTEEK